MYKAFTHLLFAGGLWVVFLCDCQVLLAAEINTVSVSRPLGMGQILSRPIVPARGVAPVVNGLPVNDWQPGDAITDLEPRVDVVVEPIVHPAARGFDQDPLVGRQQTADRATGTAVENGFEFLLVNTAGIDFTGNSHPDTSLDVGQNYILQAVNDSAAGTTVIIIDKTDPTAVPVHFSTADLAAGSGTGCATSNSDDPLVLFDELAVNGEGRWLITEVDTLQSDNICIYVSQSQDPTSGSWFIYEFIGVSRTAPDAFKLSVWPGVYIGGLNDLPNDDFGRLVVAFDRENMLLGNVLRPLQTFNHESLGEAGAPNFAFQLLQGVDFSGNALPPDGTPAVFLRHVDDEFHMPSSFDPTADFIEYYELSVDFDDPDMSQLAGPFSVAVSEFDSNLCTASALNCVPQPVDSEGQVSPPLDPNRELVMWRPTYRNFADRQQIVGAMTVDVDGNDLHGVRWFVLERETSAVSGGWSLQQEGTYSLADTTHRWLPAISHDAEGNIALVSNVSSPDTSTPVFPGIRYAGRQANDLPGSLPLSEFELQPGLSSVTNTDGRWGDYAALVVDPADQCTFWYSGQYGAAKSWSTRVASFAFEGCGEAGFDLTLIDSPMPVCSGGEPGEYLLQTTAIGDFVNPVLVRAEGLPVGSEVGTAPSFVLPGDSIAVSIGIPDGVADGTIAFNLLGSSPASADAVAAANIQVVAGVPTAATLLVPDNDSFLSVQPVRFDWTDVPTATSYNLEVATDSAFSNVIFAAEFGVSEAEVILELSVELDYFWRITSINACGNSVASDVFEFMSDFLLLDGFESD